MGDGVICAECSDRDTCFRCNTGYRLGLPGTSDEGKCLQCDAVNCATCDEITGRCLECYAGYFLDPVAGTCKTCVGSVCEECDSPTSCTKCNSYKATLTDGKCVCNTWNQWYFDSSQINSCTCGLDFLDVEGNCKMCSSILPGCASCTELDKQNEEGTHLYLGVHPEKPE